jgi:hypothetical protein
MMSHTKKSLNCLLFLTLFVFLLTSCNSNIPIIGKKKEEPTAKTDANTVTVDGMETIKGVNPPKAETSSPAQKPSPPPPSTPPKTGRESQTASVPTRPFYGSPLPFFPAGFKKKVAILDFENKTTYQEEKIGEITAKIFSDKIDATQRLIIADKAVIADLLQRQGERVESLLDPAVMKLAHQRVGVQAFTLGTVTDVGLLASKASETSDEEVSFATAKVEVRLIDASTGNPLRTFIGRSPIFGTRESGENSRGKAVTRAIELSLDEILDGFIRQLDLLDWSTTVARVEGDNLYLNAGKMSGLRIGDVFEVYEPGKEIIHPTTKLSLGWTTGQLKGAVRVTDLFGVDAASGKVVQGQGFNVNDVVKSAMK